MSSNRLFYHLFSSCSNTEEEINALFSIFKIEKNTHTHLEVPLLCSLCPIWILKYRIIMMTVVLITLIKLPWALTKHCIFWLKIKLTPWHLFTAIEVKGDKRTVVREHRSFDFNHKSPNNTNGTYCCVMKETLLLIISLFSSSTY